MTDTGLFMKREKTLKNIEDLTTVRLARFVSRLTAQDLPPSAMASAGRCVLDLTTAALAGQGTPAVQAATAFSDGFFPPGTATVWFKNRRLSPAGAAMVNSVAASVLDLDDGHRSAGGHPGASIIPACLAWAEALGRSGRDFLAAVVIGYEIAVRIASARDMPALDTFSTGRWCGYGAAAAAGWLKKTDTDALAHALSVSGIHAPIQSASAYSRLGHNTKEGIPWATLSGLAGLEMAEHGFTGPLDILDHPDYFDRTKIIAGLGETWAIEETYFKPYSCCRWLHAAIDGMVDLMDKHRIAAGNIQSITVQTFRRALGLKNEISPQTLEAAQFSLPFCLAVAAVQGPQALVPLTADLLNRPDLLDWAGRVKFERDESLDAMFPKKTAARVILKTGEQTVARVVEHPKGDPVNPLQDVDLEKKLTWIAQKRLPEERIHAILTGLQQMAQGDAAEIAALLREVTL